MRRLSGLRASGKEEEMITFVEDRVFNDFRYHINSDRLFQLGWREQVGWEGKCHDFNFEGNSFLTTYLLIMYKFCKTYTQRG